MTDCKNWAGWTFITQEKESYPLDGLPVYALVEETVGGDITGEEPIIGELVWFERIAGLLPDSPISAWKLVNFDPDEQDEILQPNYTVVAWRYRYI